MKKVTMVQTFDDALHDSHRAAKAHLDKLYSDTLTHIGHKLAKCDGKYSKLLECVDENLRGFETLLIIKQDMDMEKDDRDDD